MAFSEAGDRVFGPNVFCKNTSKNKLPTGALGSGCQNDTVPERGKSQNTDTEFEIFGRNVFFKNTSKNKFPTGDEDSRTQNDTVPERGKSQNYGVVSK